MFGSLSRNLVRQYLELPRAVHILCLGTLVNRAGSFFLVFLTIYIGDKLGFGPRFATLCMGVFGFGSLCGSLIGGQLADQFGRQKVMVCSLIVGSTILVVFAFVTVIWLIPIIIFLYALTMDMYRPAASAMIGDITRPEQRAPAFGLMYIAINLGFACGASIGGWLVARFGYVLLFIGDASTTFTYGLIVLLLLRETLPDRRRPFPVLVDDPAESTRIAPSSTFDPVPSAVSMRDAARHILGDWPFLAFCTGGFLIASVFMQSMSTLPLYLKSLGFQPNEYGWIIGLNGALIVVFQAPLTLALTRFDRMRTMTTGSIILAIGFGLTAFATTWIQFAGTVVIWTLAELMQAPFTQAVIADLAPVSMRARYMGVFTMCWSLAMAVGAPVGGYVLDRFGGSSLWFACFGTGLVSAAILAIASPAIRTRKAAA